MSQYTFGLILLFSVVILSMAVSAEESTDFDASVESSIDVFVINGTSLRIELTADVSFITLPANEIQYSKEDIAQADSEMLGAIKYALKSDIVSQLKSCFPNSEFEHVYSLPTFESGFFVDKYNVSLTSGFFSMNESVSPSELVNGLLDAGVFVNYSFPWNAVVGWNNTFTLILSEELGYKRTNGDVQSNQISWEVLNGEGSMGEREGTITLKDLNPTTDPSQNETVSLLFSLNCQKADDPAMNVQLKAHRLDMKQYSCMPSVLSLPASVPADGIRLCVENNLTSYDMIHELSIASYVEDAITALKKSSFNQSFNTSFLWDELTTVNCSPAFVLNEMNEQPAVTGVLFDPSVNVRFFNITGKAFFGLINAGGKASVSGDDVNFANVFDTSQLPSFSELLLPQHVLFNDNQQVSWNHSTDFSGEFTSEKSPSYTSQNVNRKHVINIKSTDLNLLSFFTGKTEVNLGIGFEKTRSIFVLSRSSDLFIPNTVSLPFVNADAFRLCVEEEVFSTEEINQYLNSHKTDLENTSKRLFPSIKGSAVNDADIFQESLQWDGNISSMNSETPVSIHQRMESTAPLSCHFSLFPPQFSFATQNFTFIGVPNEKVTYNMTFPKGVSINILSSSPPVIEKSVEDGKTLLSVTLNASETGKVATVHLSMEPSFLYVIGLFVPCIISVVITLILFIVVYVIRKKRNVFRQNGRQPPSENEEDSYENEEYYIPPRPPSSR
ncbi:MAG: hypothetical protein KGY50_00975 [Candidatus Thermoplasmatota archaeon]|nr:hypothetical protein [Candidatus Thermoplasmatota archaeon]